MVVSTCSIQPMMNNAIFFSNNVKLTIYYGSCTIAVVGNVISEFQLRVKLMAHSYS